MESARARRPARRANNQFRSFIGWVVVRQSCAGQCGAQSRSFRFHLPFAGKFLPCRASMCCNRPRPRWHLQIDYARELNEQQFAAVTALPGPALVIAGAGSGKTRTLTYRVAYLLEQGIPPERILLLTFTNKAAKEMMRRVADILGGDLSALWGGTFHSIASRLLRRHADRLGYRKDFTILDREDSKDLIKAVMDESQIDVKATRFPKPDVLSNIFSLAANTEKSHRPDSRAALRLLPGACAGDSSIFISASWRANEPPMSWISTICSRSGSSCCKEHADVAEQYQRRFQFILVDEYQDTNKIQSDIIDLLAARHHNLMVVGDDSQSIYSWRGAHFLNILQFPAALSGSQDLQDRDQLPQHSRDPGGGQRRYRAESRPVRQTTHARPQIRIQTGPGGVRRCGAAGGLCCAAHAGAARRGVRA